MAENATDQPKEEIKEESTENVEDTAEQVEDSIDIETEEKTIESTTEAQTANESGTENTNTEEIDPTQRDFPAHVGDTVIVSTKIQEDDRIRIQKFEGLIIGIKGAGISKTFTVRRIGANEIGIERIFPMYSPLIENVEIKRAGKVRRAKLNYLRDRKGKRATFVKPAK